MTYANELIRFHRAAALAGIDYADAETLRRSAMTLHRVAEHECNGHLCTAEAGMVDHRGNPLIEGKVYAVSNENGPGPLRYYRTADRDTPARARADAIAAKYGGTIEYQGDPRGWPLTLKLADNRDICPPCR